MARDEKREARIENEIIVDAYGPEEQAMGWYYYLDEHLHVPFRARCIATRTISPLREGEVVTVTGMAPEDDCMHEMFVLIQWQDVRWACHLRNCRLSMLTMKPSRQLPIGITGWHRGINCWGDARYTMAVEARDSRLLTWCHHGNASRSNYSQSSAEQHFQRFV